MSIPIRLAADIGGTFTDVVLESEAGFQSTKVLTTLNQPEIRVMQGIDELLRLSNIEPGQIPMSFMEQPWEPTRSLSAKEQKQHS